MPGRGDVRGPPTERVLAHFHLLVAEHDQKDRIAAANLSNREKNSALVTSRRRSQGTPSERTSEQRSQAMQGAGI